LPRHSPVTKPRGRWIAARQIFAAKLNKPNFL
jgi:hypothetical protein